MKRSPLKRRTPLRKKSAQPISKLKDKLWELCKLIIRKRHGNICYTCYTGDLSGSNWHTGHYITSSVCAAPMRYDLRNLRPQCYACNVHKSGNWVAFQEHLQKDGIDTDALIAENNKLRGGDYDRQWYEARIEEYRAIYAAL